MQGAAANIWRLILNTGSVITEAISQMKAFAMSFLFDFKHPGTVEDYFNNLISQTDTRRGGAVNIHNFNILYAPVIQI